MTKFNENIKLFAELAKLRITSFVMLTTAFGYVSYKGSIDEELILPLFGILLLACSSASVNHIQEAETDSLMERTRRRPIPSGRISSINAAFFAAILFLAGSVLLAASAGMTALLLALLNFLWYNAIYTPLKKINTMAIVPGSLVGAIPPMVGWVAAGGSIFDPGAIIIAFFFFIWQIPHFWLLLLVLSEDYKKAGFPTLTDKFKSIQLARITFIWILAVIVTGLMIPLFGLMKTPVLGFSLFGAGLWLAFRSTRLLKPDEKSGKFIFAFNQINLFALLVMLIISIDKLIPNI
ncbi:MAG: UbiA family prenyltransferase [Ignavibacteriaceae bacterium]